MFVARVSHPYNGSKQLSLSFTKPKELIGRFGVVKLWPDIQVAEDEVIARLKNTARALGLECVVVDHVAKMIDPPYRQMTQDDLDFVIHLHYETPKSYDIFSFVALWNPLQFYLDWGYRRFSNNLLSHDDFLSCSSPAADDHISRLIANDENRCEPFFHMYHSLSEPILKPTLGDHKLFYSGINWERLGRGKSRHQEILDNLDETSHLRIYGPRILRGTRVWEGYKSYQGPLSFDGVTSIREINRAGISLVLSSEAHKESGLMSNRLFEGLAGGAVIICDENPFAKIHFGDTLLYIDLKSGASEATEQILKHLDWIKANPMLALEMANKAQAIFEERFRLDIALKQIYENFQSRKEALALKYSIAGEARELADTSSILQNLEVDALPLKQGERLNKGRVSAGKVRGAAIPALETDVTVFMLMPEFTKETLTRHINNICNQTYLLCNPIMVVDEFDLLHFAEDMQKIIDESGQKIALKGMPFYLRNGHGQIIKRRKIGAVLEPLISGLNTSDFFCFIAPNETIYANHIQTLAACLSRDPHAGYAYANMLRHYHAEYEMRYEVHEKLDIFTSSESFPLGFGRLLFRREAIDQKLANMLRYLDRKAVAALTIYLTGIPSKRSTAIIEIQDKFNELNEKPTEKFDHNVFQKQTRNEFEIIRDFNPVIFDRHYWLNNAEGAILASTHMEPVSISINKLSRRNRQVLLVQLLQSLPIPTIFWTVLRRFYHGASGLRGRLRR